MKKFNVVGICTKDKHYVVDISEKINKILNIIDEGEYFTINRPRQYGKTSTLYTIENVLRDKYCIMNISFEESGQVTYSSEQLFCIGFLEKLSEYFETEMNQEMVNFIENEIEKTTKMESLSRSITKIIKLINRDVVLMIDEVDKSLDNQIFLNFLGMLRNKFLKRQANKDITFHCVILSSVHDIKNLKLKFRPTEERKYNSPWNIAIDFKISMEFSPDEISTMFEDYQNSTKIMFDKEKISQRIYFWTSGYPVLVNYLCKYIDECLHKVWTLESVDTAVKNLVNPTDRAVIFDDLIKNIENDKDIYTLIENMLLNGQQKSFNIDNPTINKGVMYGILKEDDGKTIIHNRIYFERIYNYLSSKAETNADMTIYNFKNKFVKNGKIDFKEVILSFQQFMKEQYSKKDKEFLEREGRLLFLAFIKPIINGDGFDFKEVQISEEKRLDVVITFRTQIFVTELKIWRGEPYHKKGLIQLCEYLGKLGLETGYLIIFNFNNDKQYLFEQIKINEKNIFCVVV